jgi:hypothetical protein
MFVIKLNSLFLQPVAYAWEFSTNTYRLHMVTFDISNIAAVLFAALRVQWCNGPCATTRLDGIFEPVDVIAIVLESKLLFGSPSVTSGGVSVLLLLVLSAQVKGHDGRRDDHHGAVSDVDGVTLSVSGLVGGRVDETTNNSSSVSETDDDGGGDRFLQRTSTVVGSPRDNDGNERVNTGRGEEETSVLNVRVLREQQKQEPDHSHRGERDGDNTSLSKTVGRVTSEDGGESSNDVRGDGHLRDKRMDRVNTGQSSRSKRKQLTS